MKEAEMGTELIDLLTAEKEEQLSRLNPEIADFKEILIACRTDCIEVRLLTNVFLDFGICKVWWFFFFLSVQMETIM